jgi:penicillin-binding protein 1C
VVRGTLDRDLQSAAERIVREELERLSERGVGQAAVVVLDTATRDVLAYVGSAAWRARDGQVDGARALRSPGSALKPFLYALALEDGTSSLADVIPDLPGTWRTPHGNWRPHNYDRVAGGPVRMRAALAQSLNLPAVRIADRVGVGVLLERLRALGLDTLEADAARYGLALVVGSGEVRLDALTAAYAAISDGGRHAPPRLRMDAPAAEPRPVMSALSAFLVFDALDDDDARAPAFGRESALEPEYPFATKTGTSTGWRDNWAFGTNEAVTVGVWVGNFDGSAMGQVGGTTGAAPILRRVADRAMEGRTARAPRPPAGDDAVVPVVSVRACPLSGADAGPWCGASVAEWVPRGASRAPCAWHGPRGATVPATYAAWAAANGVAVDAESAGVAPRVQYPVSGATFWIEADRPREEQAIPLRAAAAGVAGRWEVDGVTVATVGSPFTARWVPSPGEHRIVLVVDGVASAPARVRVEAASP